MYILNAVGLSLFIMQALIKNNLTDIQRILHSLGIKRCYVFGSAANGDFNEQSDIDFLLSFDDRLSIDEYSNNYFELHYQLRELLKREIDIVTERTLSNPYFIEKVNPSKVLIYEC
jgi:predicted nucleotidyltransferase